MGVFYLVIMISRTTGHFLEATLTLIIFPKIRFAFIVPSFECLIFSTAVHIILRFSCRSWVRDLYALVKKMVGDMGEEFVLTAKIDRFEAQPQTRSQAFDIYTRMDRKERPGIA